MAKNRMKSEDVKIKTPVFRVSYPNLFTAVKVNESDKNAKFGVTALFRVKETEQSKKLGESVVDIEPLKALCRAVAIEKFGADRSKWPPIGDGAGMLKFPFRLGTEPGKMKMDGYGEGVVFVVLQSVNKPGVVDAFADPSTGRPKLIEAPSDVYPGCYGRGEVNAYYWEFMGKKGISLGLQNFQKIKDGEQFGGRGNAADSFEAIDPPAAPAGQPAAAGVGASNAADPTGV